MYVYLKQNLRIVKEFNMRIRANRQKLMILYEKINFKKLKTRVSLRLSLSTTTLSAYDLKQA